MRILMLTDSFYPEVGGSETAIWRLSEALVALGHEAGVAVISKPKASSPSDKFRFWNVSSKVGGIDLKFLGKIKNLRTIIREFKPDILNVHFMLESGYVGVKAAKAEGIPVVLTNRGKGLYNEATSLQESIMYPFWNRGAAKADAYIATSEEMVDRGRERFGLVTTAISNGVEIETFRPDIDGAHIRRRYNVPDSRRVLFCARRLVPKNGIEYMVRAMPEILKKHDVELWLASPLIREYEKLKALCSELGIQDKVRFLGSIDHTELPAHFTAADVVVQPSIAEARSLACLEAMAAGSAIVATATGGLKELITHGENGYLVPEFQEATYAVGALQEKGVRDLEQAVIAVLDDEQLRQKLKKGAREYALTCSWPEIARQTLKIYEQAIASHKR